MTDGSSLGKVAGLQVARALAVTLVLLTHAIGHPYPAAPDVVQLSGRMGVTIFFVISGYIMALVCESGSFEPVGFIKKRFLRVAPLYYFVTFLTLTIALIYPKAFKDTVVELPHLLYSLAFLPSFSPGNEHAVTPFVKLGWTLNYELFFYVCFALLHRSGARRRAIALFAMFASLCTFGLLVPQTTAAGIFLTDPVIMGFPVGVGAATFLHRNNAFRDRHSVAIIAAGLLLAAGVGASYTAIRYAWYTQYILTISAVCLVYVLATKSNWGSGGPVRGAVFFGDASYSIYLFHMFAVGFTYVIGRSLIGGDWLWTLAPVALVGGAVAGIVAYLVVEKPILRAVRYCGNLAAAPTRLLN